MKSRLFVATLFLLLGGCSIISRDRHAIYRADPSGSESEIEPVEIAEKPQLSLPEPPYTVPEPIMKPTPPSAQEMAEYVRAHSDISFIIGMTAEQVSARLGPPSATIDEAPSQIWHYADESCLVIIRFYPDLKDLKFHALAYETNQKDRGEDAVTQCLTQIKRKYDHAK